MRRKRRGAVRKGRVIRKGSKEEYEDDFVAYLP